MNKVEKFPEGSQYEALYARYFQKGTNYIADLVGDYGTVIDLCGGTGRLSKDLMSRGIDVTYHDGNPQMCLLDNSISKIFCSIEDLLNMNLHFDTAVCMQAINYWFKEVDVNKLSQLSDKLIFNTFCNRPTSTGQKEYVIDGYTFQESWVMDNDKVKHKQMVVKDVNGSLCCVNEHDSEFDYISISEFTDKLSAYFHVDVTINGNSAIFVCDKLK